MAQVVTAKSADRFLIALETTCEYTIKVTFLYNKGKEVSFTKNISFL